MGAIGAVGGVGGGLGSVGDSGGGDTGPISDSGGSDSWYDAGAVMNTTGDVDNGTVTLDDGDLSSQYIDDKSRDQNNLAQQAPPTVDNAPDVPQGVGDSPSADVVAQVASCYAANSNYA